MNKNGRANLLAVAGVYSRHANRRTGACWPGHDTVVEETSLSLSTVKRHNRWLRERGWLAAVYPGSTPATRKGARPDAGNEAAVYALCAPSGPVPGRREPVPSPVPGPRPDGKTEPPTSSGRKSLPEERNPRARKRAGSGTTPPKPAEWAGGVLGRLSPRCALRLTGRFLRDGYTASDIVWAVDHLPDGTPHWQTSQVRNAPAWVTYRLSLHLVNGVPVEPRSRVLARQAAANRTKRFTANPDQAAVVRRRAAAADAATRLNPHGIPETSKTEAIAAVKAQLARKAAAASGRAGASRTGPLAPADRPVPQAPNASPDPAATAPVPVRQPAARDTAWQEVLAAAAAVVEAEEAGNALAAAAAAAERDRLLAILDAEHAAA